MTELTCRDIYTNEVSYHPQKDNRMSYNYWYNCFAALGSFDILWDLHLCTFFPVADQNSTGIRTLPPEQGFSVKLMSDLNFLLRFTSYGSDIKKRFN